MEKIGKFEVSNNLKNAIIQAVEKVGGLKNIIKKGDVVFLKPNFNTPDPFPASTDTEFLKFVTELCYENGAKLVMIGDSSTVTMNTRNVMKKIGVFELKNLEKPPRIYILEDEKWIKKKDRKWKFLKHVYVPEIIERADKLIFLPCLKTHKYAQFTGSLKLAVGLMKPFQRVPLHMHHLQEKIAELNTLFKPDLIIMDARKCFINRGPSEGDVREPNLILASKSRTTIDIEGVKIIQGYQGNSLKGINPEDLPQIKRALEMDLE